MSFTFSLAPVLRVRLLREEREERLLQQILLQLRHVANQIHAIEVELARQNQQRMQGLPRVAAARDVHGTYGTFDSLKQRRRELEAQVDRLELLRDQQWDAYQKAQRERKTIADLRDGAHRLYLKSEGKKEQRRMDAYAAYLHQRRAM